MSARLVLPVLGAVLIAAAGPAAASSETSPLFPGLVDAATGKPVRSTEFYPAKKCRGCHADLFNQWQGSMHSNAYRDPIFQALWKLGSDEAGGEPRRDCAGCHTAVGTLDEEFRRGEDGGFQVSEIAEQGVQCHLCHSVVRSGPPETRARPGNASIVVDPGRTMRGPYRDARPAWHQAEYSELHTRAEFCSICHAVLHPVANFRIGNTYDEWKRSVYAEKGIVCQDCHMMPVETSVEVARTLERPTHPGKASPMGPPRDLVFTHELVGGNFAVTGLLGAEHHAELARRRLQSAATLELRLPDEVGEGSLARFTVRVHNVGAGHNLPTSLTEVRQMWLEVSVKDAVGAEMYRSGALDAERNLTEGTVLFRAEEPTVEGKPAAGPRESERFAREDTIPPKGFADREFTFPVPPGARGPFEVAVKLRYRSYPQRIVNRLLGERAPVLPIVDMAAAGGQIGGH